MTEEEAEAVQVGDTIVLGRHQPGQLGPDDDGDWDPLMDPYVGKRVKVIRTYELDGIQYAEVKGVEGVEGWGWRLLNASRGVDVPLNCQECFTPDPYAESEPHTCGLCRRRTLAFSGGPAAPAKEATPPVGAVTVDSLEQIQSAMRKGLGKKVRRSSAKSAASVGACGGGGSGGPVTSPAGNAGGGGGFDNPYLGTPFTAAQTRPSSSGQTS